MLLRLCFIPLINKEKDIEMFKLFDRTSFCAQLPML